MMKKIIGMLTVILLLATLVVMAVPVSATEYTRIEASATKLRVGDYVLVTFYIDYAEKVPSLGVKYTFDQDVLSLRAKTPDELIEDEDNGLDPDPTYSNWKLSGAFEVIAVYDDDLDAWTDYTAGWSHTSPRVVNRADGVLVLAFNVDKLAVGGQTTITFNVAIPDVFDETLTLTLDTVCDEHTYEGDWADAGEEGHKRVCTTENCTGFELEPHTWDEGKVTTEATCNTKGVMTYECTVCDASYTEDIEATGKHTYGSWTDNGDGTHIHTCTGTDCGDTQTEKHTWDEGEVTTEPTCCDEGVTTYNCTECDATKAEPIEATGEHLYGDWIDNGDGTHTCKCKGTGCNESKTEAHTWGEGEVTTEPTCITEGVRTYTCECGATSTEVIEATGIHTYGAWVDNEDGTHTHTCETEGCDASETKDHVWGEGEVTTEPTCCDEGERTYTCECGATSTEVIEATGIHTYGAWEKVDDETHIRYCTGTNCEAFETGAHEWLNKCDTNCDACGHTRETTHNFSEVFAFNANGHWHNCLECGSMTVAEAHTFAGNTCVICAYTKPVNQNQFMSGYIYVNDEYHMIIMTNGVITTSHVLDANGNCIFCLEHITDTEEVIVEIEDPIESTTDEEEIIEVPEVEETPEVEENPKTGIALGLVALAASAMAVVFSKRR